MLTAIILLLLAIPLGIYLSMKAHDELKQGKKWFIILIVLSIGAAMWFGWIGRYDITFTAFFIAIVSFISYVQSFQERFKN